MKFDEYYLVIGLMFLLWLVGVIYICLITSHDPFLVVQ
jgi:hypothetical protein